ncbi:MAG: hypothetical protein LIO44_04055, partial [Eubacterium sp.]|nr:hypothetical protein [Eubacterium sp.]
NDCDFKSIIRGAARFHKAASFGTLNEYSDFCIKNTVESFLDKGARLNRLRRHIYRKKRLDDIDYIFLKNYEYYYKLTQEAAEGLIRYGYDREEERGAAEGQIIINNADEETMLLYPSGIYYTELLKLAVGSPLEDLRLIITRYLKKNSRPDLTAEEIINEYSAKGPLSRRQINLLYYLLIFPERYIKTYSDYYRKGHVFIPIYVKEAIKKIIDNRERHFYWISELLK